MPAVLDRSGIDFTPGLYRNDTLPICTAVALANYARAYSWLKARTDIVVVEDKVVQFFAQTEGVADTDAAIEATGGAVMMDIMGAAERSGFDVGQQTPLVPLVEACHSLDIQQIAHAAWTCGAANLGVALSLADQQMQRWDIVAPADFGDTTPGSWGQHDLILWDWEGLDPTSWVRLGTWGYWQYATWRWVLAATHEAYALRWPQLDPAA